MRAHSIKYEAEKNIELRKTSPAQAPTVPVAARRKLYLLFGCTRELRIIFHCMHFTDVTYRVIQDLSYIRFLFVFILCCLCYENWIYLHNMFRRFIFRLFILSCLPLFTFEMEFNAYVLTNDCVCHIFQLFSNEDFSKQKLFAYTVVKRLWKIFFSNGKISKSTRKLCTAQIYPRYD